MCSMSVVNSVESQTCPVHFINLPCGGWKIDFEFQNYYFIEEHETTLGD